MSSPSYKPSLSTSYSRIRCVLVKSIEHFLLPSVCTCKQFSRCLSINPAAAECMRPSVEEELSGGVAKALAVMLKCVNSICGLSNPELDSPCSFSSVAAGDSDLSPPFLTSSSLCDGSSSNGFSSKSSSSVSSVGISRAGFSSSLISFLVISTISSCPDSINDLVKASISFESVLSEDTFDSRRELSELWSRYFGMNRLNCGLQGIEMKRLRTSRFPSAIPRSQRSSTSPFCINSICLDQRNRSAKAAQLFL
mmetsp:Transcript_14863/g.37435  ORF Transcript_14863/g.37435 Transcript_14863/m.37435 type:complete len:252 (-) Transcript_14863:1355-2110(-)